MGIIFFDNATCLSHAPVVYVAKHHICPLAPHLHHICPLSTTSASCPAHLLLCNAFDPVHHICPLCTNFAPYASHLPLHHSCTRCTTSASVFHIWPSVPHLSSYTTSASVHYISVPMTNFSVEGHWCRPCDIVSSTVHHNKRHSDPVHIIAKDKSVRPVVQR